MPVSLFVGLKICSELRSIVILSGHCYILCVLFSFSCPCMDTNSLSPVWTSRTTALFSCPDQRTGTSRSGGWTLETATNLFLLMMIGNFSASVRIISIWLFVGSLTSSFTSTFWAMNNCFFVLVTRATGLMVKWEISPSHYTSSNENYWPKITD